MSIDWDLVVRAIGLFTGFQLIILSIFMIKEKKYFLAGLGIVFIAWFARTFFWDILYAKYNIFALALIGGAQELFVPPTIYLMIYALCHGSVPKKKLINYLPSLAFYIYFLALRVLYTQEEFNQIKFDYWFVLYVFYLSVLVFVFGYFTFQLLQKHKNLLIKRAYLKYSFLFWLIMPDFFIASWTSVAGVSHLLGIQWLADIRLSVFMNIMYTITYAMFFIQGVFLVIIMLSELSIFKKWQLPKNIRSYQRPVFEKEGDLRQEFILNGLHKTKDLTVESASRQLNITKKQLTDYIHQKEKVTFNQFINELRIDEFKRMLMESESQKYDLVSIAQMAGFSSKATFNRVFREKEGVTPSEYKKNTKTNQLD